MIKLAGTTGVDDSIDLISARMLRSWQNKNLNGESLENINDAYKRAKKTLFNFIRLGLGMTISLASGIGLAMIFNWKEHPILALGSGLGAFTFLYALNYWLWNRRMKRPREVVKECEPRLEEFDRAVSQLVYLCRPATERVIMTTLEEDAFQVVHLENLHQNLKTDPDTDVERLTAIGNRLIMYRNAFDKLHRMAIEFGVSNGNKTPFFEKAKSRLSSMEKAPTEVE